MHKKKSSIIKNSPHTQNLAFSSVQSYSMHPHFFKAIFDSMALSLIAKRLISTQEKLPIISVTYLFWQCCGKSERL